MDTTPSALLQPASRDLNQNCDVKTDIVITQQQPSSTSSLLSHLSALLPSNFLNLPPRWRDWFIRGQSGLLLISCFTALVSAGPMGLFLLTHIVTVTTFTGCLKKTLVRFNLNFISFKCFLRHKCSMLQCIFYFKIFQTFEDDNKIISQIFGRNCFQEFAIKLT